MQFSSGGCLTEGSVLHGEPSELTPLSVLRLLTINTSPGNGSKQWNLVRLGF